MNGSSIHLKVDVLLGNVESGNQGRIYAERCAPAVKSDKETTQGKIDYLANIPCMPQVEAYRNSLVRRESMAVILTAVFHGKSPLERVEKGVRPLFQHTLKVIFHGK